ncbi:CRISPR-associated endonuclease Cas2 [Candidatus Uhrbacteria bacterium]|jgi:hypothetical protein|nr:CRISPR-associated endonuclease Cas2 [Candidatus Uhrbacteria bacterium]MBT7717082.1 CRISPR-associated endonuclease Cas2 [Candidatus Uhrbacteria bacterium]
MKFHELDDRLISEEARPLRPHSRTSKILVDIGKAIEDAHFGLSRPGLVVRFGLEGAREFLNRKEMRLRRQELKRLEQRKMIQRKKIEGEYWTSFSKSGFEEYIAQLSINADKLPVGQLCLVSFDIPENQKRLRNKVRRILKRLGFRQIHRSVWCCSSNVSNYVAKLFSSKFKADNWFKIYLASEL